MDFAKNLWDSVFTPGTTPTLVKATHASFFALELTLVSMLYVTRSLHFVALIIIASGLWLGITWFINESQRYTEQASKASLKDIKASEITSQAGTEIREQTPPEIIELPSSEASPEPAKSKASSTSTVSPAKTRSRRKRTV